MKGEGGVIGLAENMAAHRHWMECGSEISGLIEEFELSIEITQKTTRPGHHELTNHTEEIFLRDDKPLKEWEISSATPAMTYSNLRAETLQTMLPLIL